MGARGAVKQRGCACARVAAHTAARIALGGGGGGGDRDDD